VRLRALVVRSGENPLPFAPDPSEVEIVERISHTIIPLLDGEEGLDRPADLAIFTSQIAVRRLFEEPRVLASFRRALQKGRIAAVGEATAAALRARGVSVDIVASGSSENVLKILPGELAGQRIILPRGEDAAEELPEGLIQRGAQVAPLLLYRKKPRPHDLELDREIVERPFSAFCTTSPAAARWLFAGISEAALARLRETPAVVLGRFTGRFLASHGIARVEVAADATFSSAAKLLIDLAGRVQSPESDVQSSAQDDLEP
jgi:uroporphyrinogen III methyltransferase / synthase